MHNPGREIKFHIKLKASKLKRARVVFPILLGLALAFTATAARAALKPVGPIRYPLPTRPVIAVRGACFTADVAAGETAAGWEAAISTRYNQEPLTVKNATFLHKDKLWKVELCVPGDAPEELYDLEITTAAAQAHTRRAVKVIPRYRDEYSFVHITDVHTGCCKKVDQYSRERVLEHPSEEIFARVAEEVNLIHPEFVLITGDITSAAEGVARMQGKIEGTVSEDEFRDFLDILARFEVPTFVVPGNHDLVGTQIKVLLEFWEKYFAHRYYSFNYGDAYFLGIDNSNAMEATTFLYRKASIKLDEEQREWLIGDLDRSVARALKIFFFHVNTNRKEINKLADDYGAHLALFGHWHMDDVKTAGAAPTTWIQTKSLLGKGGYRLVRVKNNRVVSHSVDGVEASLTWKDLALSFSPANDGAHNSVTAVIDNSTPGTFENARLKFIMPRAESYSVSGGTEPFGGEIAEILTAGEKAAVYVRTTIQPSGKTIVTVVKD